MKSLVRVRLERSILLGLLAGGVVFAPGCTPQVVRSSPPPVPNSAAEMAEDTERLETLIGAGLLRKEELKKHRDFYQGLVEDLRGRDSRNNVLQSLLLSRAELTLALYDELLALAEQKPASRAERTAASARAYGAMRDYLRKVSELEQGISLLPEESVAISPAIAGELTVQQLPPPTAQRLLSGYRAGRYEQVVREVEGAGPDALSRMEPAAVAAYALALGGLGRYADALKVAPATESQMLLPPEQLELRYRESLWLVKIGRRDEAVQRLRQLNQEVQSAGDRLEGLKGVVQPTLEEVSRSSPRFAESLVDVRLKLEAGRYEEARAQLTQMLERESAVDAVNRVEGLLKRVDSEEEKAFQTQLAEVQGIMRMDGGLDAAAQALTVLEQRFRGARYQERIQAIRRDIEDQKMKSEVRARIEAESKGGQTPASTNPAVVPGGAAHGSGVSGGTGSPAGTAMPPAGAVSPPSTGAPSPSAAPAGTTAPAGQAPAGQAPAKPSGQAQVAPSQGTTEQGTGAATAPPHAPSAHATGSTTGSPPGGPALAASSPTNTSPPGPSASPQAPAQTSAPVPTPSSASASPPARQPAASVPPSGQGPAQSAAPPAQPAAQPNGAASAPARQPSQPAASAPQPAPHPGQPAAAAPLPVQPSAQASASTPPRSSGSAPAPASSSTGQASTGAAPPGATASSPPAGTLADWQRTLAQGKSLVTAGRFEDAAKAFASLKGTPIEAEAEAERLKAVDRHVQLVRERVAREYVRAQGIRTTPEKLALFGELYTTLKTTLERYPETTLKAKAEHNLKVIEQELKKLDPSWFEKQGAGQAGAGQAP